MRTALHYYGVPDELVRLLVEQGLDINIENYYGRTSLYVQAIDSNHIAIDCGCNSHHGRLAAIHLDDGKEFYSSSKFSFMEDKQRELE